MKKLLLLTKTLLAAALFCVGQNAWGEETVGASDLSTGYLGAHSTVLTVADGGTIHYTFTQSKNTANNYLGWLLYAGTTGEAVNWDNAKVILRGDNWEDKAGSNTGCTNNFNWDTFNDDMNGATIDMAISYSSGTISMSSLIVKGSKQYSYSYSKAIDGAPATIDVCLSVNAAYLTITTSKYYAPSGAATIIDATLVHTAGAKWGSGYDGTYESTVDAAAEFYNSESTNWKGSAYAKFSYESIPVEATITNATLTYNTNQGGSYGRTEKIYYMAKDFDLDWANFAGQKNVDLSYSANRVSSISVATGGKGDRENLTGNVTSFVSALYSGGQKYILFQWTDNAGGANLYGKGSTTKAAPSLSISYTTSSTASYTVKYYDTEGNYIKDGATYSGIPVGSIVTASSSDKASFVYSDKKYTYNCEGICVIDGTESNILKVYCTTESKIAYTITAKCGEDDLGSIGSGSVFASDNTNVYWNKHILVDGIWYVTNSPYGKAITAAGNTDVEFVANNKIYKVIECESTTYSSAGDETSTSASGGVGVLLALGKAMATTSKIPAGKYDISIYGYVRRANEDQLKLQYSTDNSTWTDLGATLTFESSKSQTPKAEKVVLTADSYVRFVDNKNQNSCHYYDYIIFEKFVDVTVSAAGFATYVDSDYDLDFSATEIEAYKVKVSSKGVATLTKVNNVPANTPVLLYKEGGATENIPVMTGAAAVTENDLVAGNSTTATEGVATTDGDYTNMILNNIGGKIGFYFAAGNTVAANRAYLHFASTLAPDPVGGSSPARMAMRFAGDITGINEAKAEAVQKDGKFFKNGKLVIFKNGKKFNANGAQIK